MQQWRPALPLTPQMAGVSLPKRVWLLQQLELPPHHATTWKARHALLPCAPWHHAGNAGCGPGRSNPHQPVHSCVMADAGCSSPAQQVQHTNGLEVHQVTYHLIWLHNAPAVAGSMCVIAFVMPCGRTEFPFTATNHRLPAQSSASKRTYMLARLLAQQTAGSCLPTCLQSICLVAPPDIHMAHTTQPSEAQHWPHLAALQSTAQLTSPDSTGPDHPIARTLDPRAFTSTTLTGKAAPTHTAQTIWQQCQEAHLTWQH